jgi:hypothetical protein
MSDDFHDELDAEVAAHLARAAGRPPYDEVDWDALARRIRAAALGGRVVAARRRWWEHAALWTRAAIPLAVAAGMAAVALISLDRSAATESVEPGGTLIEAVTGVASDQDVAVSMVGQPTTASFAAEVLAQ